MSCPVASFKPHQRGGGCCSETNLLLDKAGEASDGLDDRARELLFAHEAGNRPPVADLLACLTTVGEASMAYIAVANSADAAGE